MVKTVLAYKGHSMCYRLIIGFAAFFMTISFVIGNVNSVYAIDAKNSYRQQNDVLYYGEGCAAAAAGPVGSSATSSGGGGGCGSDDPAANKQQIWSFLKSKGLNDDAAAGIMGNMEQESSFNPKATNGIGCRGVVQWCFGRNDGLDSFAGGKGTSWDCLGTQLEYMWHEMTETDQGNVNGAGERLEIPLVDALNGKPFSNSSKYTKSGAYNAGAIFHDYFERANTATGEDLGRGERAEEIYKEFTGKAADTSLLSNSQSSSGGNACPTDTADGGGGGIMSEECTALVQKYDTLKASGKITPHSSGEEEFINTDLKNCTTDQIECGGEGKKGGVHPRLLRAVVAAAENSGASTLDHWNINTGHGCDQFRHPMGMASDIYCIGNNQSTGQGASEDCNKIFKYFYDNYDELGITELIWQYPPDGYSCDDPKIMCSGSGDHSNHIHISTEVTSV